MGYSEDSIFESVIAACMHAQRIKIVEKLNRTRLELSVQRIGHGKEGSAEMGTDVVGVPPAQLHLDVDGLHVGSDVLDANARAKKRGPQIDQTAEVGWAFRAAQNLQKNIAAHMRRSRLRWHGQAAAVNGFEDLVASALEQGGTGIVA